MDYNIGYDLLSRVYQKLNFENLWNIDGDILKKMYTGQKVLIFHKLFIRCYCSQFPSPQKKYLDGKGSMLKAWKRGPLFKINLQVGLF